MRRPGLCSAAAIVLALGALAAAACTGGDERSVPPGTFTAEDVIEHFEEEAGHDLAVDPTASTTKVVLVRPDQEANAEFGEFEVFVVNPRDPNIERVLRVGLGFFRLPADRRGIRWQRTRDGWVAAKRYGRNVVLAWHAARTRGALDARWEELDRVFASLG